MNLQIISSNAAYFTDESFSETMILGFANSAIARINSDCKTYFKDFVGMSEKYTDIPKNWLNRLVTPYISYAIKMNDTSLTEAQMYLEEFTSALMAFQEQLGTLVEIYRSGDTENGISPSLIQTEGFGGAYGIDTSQAIDKGWFNNNSNGGSY